MNQPPDTIEPADHGQTNTLTRGASTRSKRSSRPSPNIKYRKTRARERRVFYNLPLPTIYLDRSGEPRAKWASNKIVTSKYTLLTFIPKNLFEQFRRAANMYFLLMAVLGMLPQFSVNNPVLTLLPLSFVIFITACKDAYEDYNRHVIDENFNSSQCYHLQNYVNVNYPSGTKQSFWKGLILRIKRLRLEKVTKPNENSPDEKGEDKTKDDDVPADFPSNLVNGPPKFKKTQWKHVRVGDFLYLRNGDAVPADSVIISTSEPEGNCFVETKDLDGETNLKPRRCVADTKYIQTPEDCAKLDCYIDSEAPNSNLFYYNATLVLTDLSETPGDSNQPTEAPKWSVKKVIPLDINNLLLRAHVIRNTEWVIAATVFTGIDTKIILNSGETPSKRSRIEKEMNREVVFNFFVLLILALICAVGFVLSMQDLFNKTNGLGPKLLDNNSSSYVEEGFLTFGASLIIFQNIIPISLYISIEFVKTFQAYFIYNDLDMWDEESQKNCVPKSWNLSDDLGQIEYVFSDKTGTLTRNIMEFRQCSINGKVYGRNGWGGKTDAEKGKEIMQKGDLDGKDEQTTNDIWWQYTQELKKTFDPKYASLNPDFLTFVDPEIFTDVQNESASSDVEGQNNPHVKEFFILLAICHTVVVDAIPPPPKESGDSVSDSSSDQNGNASNEGSADMEKKKSSSILGQKIRKKLSNSRLGTIVPSLKISGRGPGSSISSKQLVVDDTVMRPLIYKAESPDEAALVSAAKNLGFAFLSRTNNSLTVDILGTEYTFEILNTLEFNSTRKRMSIIARRPKELGDDIVLFCKGADSVIFDRLADGQDELIEKTNNDIEEFSNDGLRTLTLAYRILEPSHYETWLEKYREASAAIEDRAELVDACSEEIENDLILLGATAIEDKLQEGVPDCIASLREAGIKVWVLTGDKLETAINIGFAAQLLTKEMRLWVVKNSNKEEVIRQFDEVVDSLIGQHGIANSENKDETKERHAFIVDGGALAHLLDNPGARERILQVSEVFHSVVCCRVSPLQKALVVDLVKKGKKAVTLSIGDGANDVSMIQAANVGVGISGQEGVQASMAADYAISQFRFLKKLLLVHGHWDYLRIAEMILNFFYKNVIWVFPVLWYQIYCQFSANIFYDYSLVQLYNMIFTVAPVVALGGTDQSVTAKYCMQYPGIYALGIKQSRYSRTRFAIYFLDGIWQSLVVYFVSHFVYMFSQGVTSHNAYNSGPAEMSTAVAVTAIIIANVFVGFNTYHWTWFMFTTVIVEIVLIFAFVFVYGAFYDTLYGIGQEVFSRGEFWFGLVLGFIIAALPRYVVTFVKQWWYPDDLDIVRQIKRREKAERVAVNKKKNKEERQYSKTNQINVPNIEVNPA